MRFKSSKIAAIALSAVLVASSAISGFPANLFSASADGDKTDNLVSKEPLKAQENGGGISLLSNSLITNGSDIIDALGDMANYAVYANEFTQNAHMEGNVYTNLYRNAEISGNTVAVYGLTASGSSFNTSVDVSVLGGPKSTTVSYRLGYSSVDNAQSVTYKDFQVTTDASGNGTATVELTGLSSSVRYTCSIVDSQGNAINNCEVKIENNVLASTSNVFKIKAFSVGNASAGEFLQNAGATRPILYYGTDYTLEADGLVVGDGKVGFGANNLSNGYVTLKYDPTVDSAPALENAKTLSANLAGAVTNDNLIVYNVDFTPYISNGSISDDNVKTAFSSAFGYYDNNDLQNRKISIPDGKYVIINVNCGGIESFSLPTIKFDVPQGEEEAWTRLASRIVWNYVTGDSDNGFTAYNGMVTTSSTSTIGTQLVPAGEFYLGATYCGAIYANKASNSNKNSVQGASEIHKITLATTAPSISAELLYTEPLYTVRFVYRDETTGELKEVTNYNNYTLKDTGYADGSNITMMTATELATNSGASCYDDEGNILTWKIFTDGNTIGDVLNPLTDINYNTSAGDVIDNTYIFNGSNVYFYADLKTRVNVDVTWNDNNFSGRPGTLDVKFGDYFDDNLGNKALTPADAQVAGSNVWSGTFGEFAKFFDNGNSVVVSNYANGSAVTYPNSSSGGYGLKYTVPAGYQLDTQASTVNVENGAVTYHIVLNKLYTAQYEFTVYDVEGNGTTTQLSALTTTDNLGNAQISLPSMPQGTFESLVKNPQFYVDTYKLVWRDKATGKLYEAGRTYTFNNADVQFEASIKCLKTPRIYFDRIIYKQSSFIKGKITNQILRYYQMRDVFDNTFLTDTEVESLTLTDNYTLLYYALNIDSSTFDKAEIFMTAPDGNGGEYTYNRTETDTTVLPTEFNVYGDVKSNASGRIDYTFLNRNAEVGDNYILAKDGDKLIYGAFIVPESMKNTNMHFVIKYTDTANNNVVWGTYDFTVDGFFQEAN